jgi:MoxR-like ATPase
MTEPNTPQPESARPPFAHATKGLFYNRRPDPPKPASPEAAPRSAPTSAGSGQFAIHDFSPPAQAEPPKLELRSGPLPRPVRRQLNQPVNYQPSDELVAAVNAALMLRMPLLLMGPPGTGKTELAESVARQLHGLSNEHRPEPPFYFSLTVTSAADKSDVLYRYDELRRLRDSYNQDKDEEGKPKPKPHDTEYVSLVGLGAALVAAGDQTSTLLPIPGRTLRPDLLTFGQLVRHSPANPGHPDAIPGTVSSWKFLEPGSRPPVVLIDEIDKAPRELPNDLLTELDRMQFDIPELGVRVTLHDEARWPVVIITSNAERPLPDAFLRRCVCLELTPPTGDKLAEIIEAKLAKLVADKQITIAAAPRDLAAEVASFAAELERQPEIPRPEKPATARLLDFTLLLACSVRLNQPSLAGASEGAMQAALTALVPTLNSQKRALEVWQKWRPKTPEPSTA